MTKMKRQPVTAAEISSSAKENYEYSQQFAFVGKGELYKLFITAVEQFCENSNEQFIPLETLKEIKTHNEFFSVITKYLFYSGYSRALDDIYYGRISWKKQSEATNG